jgi:NAD(P)-dependent dehydrogenase (short-subunit alcohol dehydrogenase family)
VNAVSPGVIKRPMHYVETRAQLAKMHPLGRIGEVSEIVGAILYLESASSVTGETIRVDGGQSAHHRTSYEGERYALPQSAGRTAGIDPKR